MRCAALVGWCLFLGGPLQAQKKFLNIYGTTDSDYGNSVIATDDGGYALINQTQYLGNLLPQVIRTDCNGNIIWTRAFRYGSSTTGYDLVNLGANMALLLGYHDSSASVSVLTVLDFYGNIVWAKKLPMSVPNNNGHLVAENGNIVVCGNAPGSDSTILFMRLNSVGNIIGSGKIQLSYPCVPTGICRLNTGYYAMAGTYPSLVLPGFKDVATVVTDPDFTATHASVFLTYYDDEPMGIAADNNNTIYVCGRSYFTGTNWDGFIVAYNNVLVPTFVNCYDGGTPDGEAFRSITRPALGPGMALCGDLGTFDERAPMLVKTEVNGHLVFSKQYNLSPAFTNYLFSVVPTPDNGYVMTGDVRPDFSLRDAPLFKTDAWGNDSCYAQDITLNAYVPSYTIHPESFFSFPWTATVSDTFPVVDDVPIHQTDICNPKNPCPAFYFDDYSRCPDLCYDFHDQSVDATAWHWEFEGAEPTISNAENPTGICYRESGTYNVKLVVSNSTGSTTLEKTIEVMVGCEPVFSNVITPNGDGINDVFVIGMLPKQYELKIFDRWGILINTYTEPGKSWNGTNSGGTKVIPGVYYYTFTNKISGKTYKGFVQVTY